MAVAGLGGYALARRALAPIEQMTERARTITAERLSDRLPVAQPRRTRWGGWPSVFNETLGRLEASFDQMRRFTADVSHELRTPLTAIRSVGEVGLRGHRDEAAYRGIIGSMLEEVDRLSQLVDRLLALSRAETRQATVRARHGRSSPPRRRCGVSSRRAGGGETDRRSRSRGSASPRVRADRLVLRQALINLVDNAIKFTPAIGTRPDTSVRDAVAGRRGRHRLWTGRPDHAREHIFDRFYRIDGSEVVGTGLGLSLARGGVEAIGGRLTLEQTGPEGSTFRIAIPRHARILTNTSDSLQTTAKGRTA